jgi:hypothetical protein
MIDSKQALTQKQINEMLAGEGGRQPESAENPVNVTPTSMKEIRARSIIGISAAPNSASSKEPPPTTLAPQTTLAQLVERVSQLEAAMKQREAELPGLPQLLEQLQVLSKRVDSIIANLEGTVGFGARRNFVCKNCQSQGHVAVRLHCTSCGGENWWGWWPQHRQ